MNPRQFTASWLRVEFPCEPDTPTMGDESPGGESGGQGELQYVPIWAGV